MNGIVYFRLNTLTTTELIAKIDVQTDLMFKEQKVPTRNIPARPNEDYDLLIGELILRAEEFEKFINVIEDSLRDIEKSGDMKLLSDLKLKIGRFLHEPFGSRCNDEDSESVIV